MDLIRPSNGAVIQKGFVGYLQYLKTAQCLCLHVFLMSNKLFISILKLKLAEGWLHRSSVD